MRRVNIITGIKQRLNNIFGSQKADPCDGTLTDWSVQSAMLSNFQRLCKALTAGSPNGKILNGLTITDNVTFVTIQPGYGVTPNGGLISLNDPIVLSVDDLTYGDTTYLHIKHSIVAMTGDDDGSGGKKTSLINAADSVQIVFDEAGAAEVYDDFIQKSLTFTPNVDYLYIGSVTLSGSGAITSISRDLTSYPGQVVVRPELGTPGDQDIPDSTWTKVVFGESLQDTSEEFVGSIYTAKTQGFRQVSWKVSSQASSSWDAATKYWMGMVVVNSDVDESRNIQGLGKGFAYPGVSDIREAIGSGLIFLDVGETLQLQLYQNSGVSYPIDNTAKLTFLTISTVT